MPYIKRNDQNKIDQFIRNQLDESWSFIEDDDPELIAYFETTLESVFKPAPQWLIFNAQMMGNPSYKELINGANPIIVGRIETMFITGNENWQMLKVLWQTFINSITMNLNIVEIEAMNDIASACNMPFEFDENCLMVLK